MEHPQEQTERLTQEITGATVISVVPCRGPDEGLFTLRLKKDGKKFEVRISGNDLGWWYTISVNRS